MTITLDADMTLMAPYLPAFMNATEAGLAAAAGLNASDVRVLSVVRGSVVATARASFPARVAYGAVAEFALRASAAVEAGEVAWLLGAGYQAAWGQVAAVKADVAPDFGAWVPGRLKWACMREMGDKARKRMACISLAVMITTHTSPRRAGASPPPLPPPAKAQPPPPAPTPVPPPPAAAGAPAPPLAAAAGTSPALVGAVVSLGVLLVLLAVAAGVLALSIHKRGRRQRQRGCSYESEGAGSGGTPSASEPGWDHGHSGGGYSSALLSGGPRSSAAARAEAAWGGPDAAGAGEMEGEGAARRTGGVRRRPRSSLDRWGGADAADRAAMGASPQGRGSAAADAAGAGKGLHPGSDGPAPQRDCRGAGLGEEPGAPEGPRGRRRASSLSPLRPGPQPLPGPYQRRSASAAASGGGGGQSGRRASSLPLSAHAGRERRSRRTGGWEEGGGGGGDEGPGGIVMVNNPLSWAGSWQPEQPHRWQQAEEEGWQEAGEVEGEQGVEERGAPWGQEAQEFAEQWQEHRRQGQQWQGQQWQEQQWQEQQAQQGPVPQHSRQQGAGHKSPLVGSDGGDDGGVEWGQAAAAERAREGSGDGGVWGSGGGTSLPVWQQEDQEGWGAEEQEEGDWTGEQQQQDGEEEAEEGSQRPAGGEWSSLSSQQRERLERLQAQSVLPVEESNPLRQWLRVRAGGGGGGNVVGPRLRSSPGLQRSSPPGGGTARRRGSSAAGGSGGGGHLAASGALWEGLQPAHAPDAHEADGGGGGRTAPRASLLRQPALPLGAPRRPSSMAPPLIMGGRGLAPGPHGGGGSGGDSNA
jgi:hypothetical protein